MEQIWFLTVMLSPVVLLCALLSYVNLASALNRMTVTLHNALLYSAPLASPLAYSAEGASPGH